MTTKFSQWWHDAQVYEAESGINWMRSTPKPASALQSEFFGGDLALWERFMSHVDGKSVVEVGCGPVPVVQYFPATVIRAAVDPLIDRYVAAGADFSGVDLVYSEPAEDALPRIAPITGAILCRNMLDHTDNPMRLLTIMLDSLAPGAFFVFWDELCRTIEEPGHRSVSPDVLSFVDVVSSRIHVLRESHGPASFTASSWGCVGVRR